MVKSLGNTRWQIFDSSTVHRTSTLHIVAKCWKSTNAASCFEPLICLTFCQLMHDVHYAHDFVNLFLSHRSPFSELNCLKLQLYKNFQSFDSTVYIMFANYLHFYFICRYITYHLNCDHYCKWYSNKHGQTFHARYCNPKQHWSFNCSILSKVAIGWSNRWIMFWEVVLYIVAWNVMFPILSELAMQIGWLTSKCLNNSLLI